MADSSWCVELLKDDKRWSYGIPPVDSANWVWAQDFTDHLIHTGFSAVCSPTATRTGTEDV